MAVVSVMALRISNGAGFMRSSSNHPVTGAAFGASPGFSTQAFLKPGPQRRSLRLRSKAAPRTITCESKAGEEKAEFGYSRKDVLLIGVGFTVCGVGLKYGLELLGLDSLKAGNAVQLVMVLGLTIGWIYSYVARVANKDMTYAKQLKDYELKVMEKRLEELPEAEMEVLLAQVEEEKDRQRKQKSSSSSSSPS